MTTHEMLMLVGACGLFAAGIIIMWMMTLQIPSIGALQNRKIIESTKIYDRTGNVLLYDVHGTVRRTVIPLDKMSHYVQQATIAIEDTEFYSHHGIRPLAILRSIWTDITTGSFSQGGSTITQQVVKNTLLTQDKTLTRKLKEWVLALKLEQVYTKDQILETYLNETPYGGTIYGVEEASGYFFGKHAADLTLAEAAYLAALPQAPTYYSPYGNHRSSLEARKNTVLKRMLEQKFITQDEYDVAIKEKPSFLEEGSAGIKAPHFVFYVREYLEQKYGAIAVNEGGLQVTTTLDWDLQQQGEKIIRDGALSNAKNFNATNAGLVAVDPTTGQILTMVGSRGYFDPDIDGKVNVALANRQPGSSFKPFVYATALEKGYTPDTVVFDLKTQFSTACAPQNLSDEPPCYSPDNFDGTFKGPITFRNALAQSVNVPAVKVLYLAGIQNSIDTAEKMGITTLGDPNRYGLTLVLGGGEVNLLEMTSAYGVFGDDGMRNPPTPILKVTDANGHTVEEYHDRSSQVLDPEIARTINDMLSDNVARTPEFGADSPLYFRGVDVADKTGTTNDYRDAWIIGYTPGLAVGAWAGNNDNTPMVKKIAAFIIAPIWHSFMEEALTKYPSGTFPSPAPIPTDLPPVLRGNYNTNPTQGIHDILYWIDKKNPRGGQSRNPYSDGQLALWDYPVSLWAGQQTVLGSSAGAPSTGGLSIISPTPGSSHAANQLLSISVSAPENTTSVSYSLNGQFIGTVNQAPFSYSTLPTAAGANTLRATAQTPTGSLESAVSFFVN